MSMLGVIVEEAKPANDRRFLLYEWNVRIQGLGRVDPRQEILLSRLPYSTQKAAMLISICTVSAKACFQSG